MRAVRRMAFWLPPLLILSGVLLNTVFDSGLPGSPLFLIAPLVAAPFTRTRVTVLTGVASVVGVALVRSHDEDFSSMDVLVQTATVAVVALLAVGVNRLLRRSGAALASARNIAEAAQLAVLPAPPSRLGGLDLAARYRAAQVDARIGGDLYAAQRTPYGVRLIVGDVRGKGTAAVTTVVLVIGAFREAAEQEGSLEGVARRLDRALEREAAQRGDIDGHEGFTTAVLVEIPVAARESVRVVNRGHPPPLLLADGGARYVEPSVPALPLGMTDLARRTDRADEVPFPSGAQLLLYTDGLSEARDRHGRFYEPEARLAGRFFPGPEELLDALLKDVRAHTGGESVDDMALLAVRSPVRDRLPVSRTRQESGWSIPDESLN
ncbi:Serine phosphatase RsbU, regulator of sigma subunit [Streptomyces sp. WMMB 714]|nr:Serine phosphatase RsbU, regulator of sigma subunit [Streptomyces sp. WMMB 714]